MTDHQHPTSQLIRPDGNAYIDQPDSIEQDSSETFETPADKAVAGEEDFDDAASGSSVEEEEEGSDIDGHRGGWPLEEEEEEQKEEFGDEGEIELKLEEDEEDWNIEDEDWELADGDFTKQYNRVRQQYNATHHKAEQSCSLIPTQPQQTSSFSRPVLPARNAHVPKLPTSGPAGSMSTSKRLINPALFATGVSANPKAAQDRLNQKDKADRATHEQVLDARTRLVLSSLVNRGLFGVVEGCISTGKEANVYFAYPSSHPPAEPCPYPSALAVKIYRTSILNFRARQSYIVGEHRFRGGYSSAKNPRKMIRLWAEKELRNLRRLVQGGVRAPVVIEQRENVLVMEFLGQGTTPSPRLKDAEISTTKLSHLYAELLVAMRRMYHRCKLVHADLSEYNILYHNSHIYIIDVSQSVEHDHPSAFDFLRSDIRNVEDFFVRRSNGEVKTLGVRRTWDFVVNDTLGGLKVEEESGDQGEERLFDILREWLKDQSATAPPETESGLVEIEGELGIEDPISKSAKKASDDAVFMSSYIPRSLAEVYNPERDIDVMKKGGMDALIYAGITGLNFRSQEEEKNEEEIGNEKPAATSVSFAEDDAEQGQDSEDDSDHGKGIEEKKSRGFRHEDKDAKKERKKALKEQNREKRKNKMPKAEKQRLIKKTSGK